MNEAYAHIIKSNINEFIVQFLPPHAINLAQQGINKIVDNALSKSNIVYKSIVDGRVLQVGDIVKDETDITWEVVGFCDSAYSVAAVRRTGSPIVRQLKPKWLTYIPTVYTNDAHLLTIGDKYWLHWRVSNCEGINGEVETVQVVILDHIIDQDHAVVVVSDNRHVVSPKDLTFNLCMSSDNLDKLYDTDCKVYSKLLCDYDKYKSSASSIDSQENYEHAKNMHLISLYHAYFKHLNEHK